MNKDIVLLSEDNESITIMCEKLGYEAGYTILGMNDYSCYEIIGKSVTNIMSLNRKRLKRYHNIKIDYTYLSDGKEVYIGSTNPYNVKSKLFDLLTLKFLKSYDGVTVAVTNDRYYDKYLLYELIKDRYVLIYETEDFVFTSKLFMPDKKYVIEALSKENDIYELKGKSIPFEVKFEERKPSTKTTYDLSVVIPCYNRQNYISRSIDSVLLSDLENLEIIVVNDASTDNSSEILKWYTDNYKGIVKVINNKENSGPAITRNNGIDKAKGKYISFVDSDDYVHPKTFSTLFEIGTKEKLDAVICKTLIKNEIGNTTVCLDLISMNKYKVFTYEEMFKNKMETNIENIFFTSPCNKIVKTSLVKKHKFPDLRVYEDTAFTRTLYSYIDKFGFAYNVYYVWDKRDNKLVDTISSSTKKKTDINFHDLYKKAIFYSIDACNRDRLDYIIVDAMSELYRYIKDLKDNKAFKKTVDFYLDGVIEYNKKYNILDNKYIKDKTELYLYLSKACKNPK